MVSSYEFFAIFIATILVSRIFLYFKPIGCPRIGTFRLHHWMYGAALLLIALPLKSLPTFAIGLGLFVDELPLLIMYRHLPSDGGRMYRSLPSQIGVIVMIVGVFFLKDYFTLFFT